MSALLYDAVIVGAGPAGLAAAAAVARHGASTLVVDENPTPGGQYYRSLPPGFTQEAPWMEKTARARQGLVAAAEKAGVGFALQSCVVDLQPGFRLAVHSRSARRVDWIAARAVLVAAGARELVMPFPGWTLPGVMTLGGAQNLYKAQGLAPGFRVVMAGTGPFLWLVSQQLIRAGVNVVAVAEASPVLRSVNFGRTAWRFPGMALEGLGYWTRIARSRADFLFRTAVVKAEGKERLERVELARVDRDWNPVPGSATTIEADALCVSHGLLPNTELTQLARCEHRLDRRNGALTPRIDTLFQTTVPGLFAAGETLGIGGGPVAEQEGRAAGTGMARYLGLAEQDRVEVMTRPQRAALRGRRSLVSRMFETYAPGSGALDGLADEVLVCRCEEVRLGEIRKALASGDRTADLVKSRTRCGMGRCQGRVCGPVLQRIIAGGSDIQVSPATIRPPIKPVPVGDFLTLVEQDTGDRSA